MLNSSIITSDVIVAAIGLFGGGLLSSVFQTFANRKKNDVEEKKIEYEFLKEQKIDSVQSVKLLKDNVIGPMRDELKVYSDKCATLEARIIELNKQLSDYSQQINDISDWIDKALQHIDGVWVAHNPVPMSRKNNII